MSESDTLQGHRTCSNGGRRLGTREHPSTDRSCCCCVRLPPPRPPQSRLPIPFLMPPCSHSSLAIASARVIPLAAAPPSTSRQCLHSFDVPFVSIAHQTTRINAGALAPSDKRRDWALHGDRNAGDDRHIGGRGVLSPLASRRRRLPAVGSPPTDGLFVTRSVSNGPGSDALPTLGQARRN